MLAALLLLAAVLPSPPGEDGHPDVVALGVVVSPRPGGSVALLRSGARTRIAGVGETAFGGRVVEIGPAVVALEYDGRRVELRLVAPGGAVAPASVAKTFPGPPASPRPEPAMALALSRRDVERRLAEEIPRILAETALVPVTEDGQVQGFALARIPAGSLLTDAGLVPGDVVTRINDVPIDSLATLVGLWPRLQGQSELRAVVLRNGQPITLSVTLR